METQQLWYHKYQPKKIQDYHFHQPIMKRLIRYAEHDNVLNMLIYGPPGSGKYTLAMSLLYYLLEKYPDRDCIYQKKIITSKDQEYHIFQSKYHFELDMVDYGYNDKKVLHKFILDISRNINISSQSYQMIIIKSTEHLSLDAQYTLRRTMEMYSRTCRIIFLSRNISKMDDAIKSRCFLLRVPAPSNSEIQIWIKYILQQEHEKIPHTIFKEILKLSNQNLSYILIILQYYLLTGRPLKTLDRSESLMEVLLNMLEKVTSVEDLPEVRELIHGFLLPDQPPHLFLEKIVKRTAMSKKLRPVQKNRIMEAAMYYHSMMNRGYRYIYYLEAFILYYIKIKREKNIISLIREE